MEFCQGSRDNVNVLYFCHTGLTILNRILGSSAYHESRTSENSRFAANICVFYDIRFNVPNVETNVVKYISSCSRKECSVRKMCSRNNHTNSHGIRCASVCYASSTCKASSVNEQRNNFKAVYKLIGRDKKIGKPSPRCRPRYNAVHNTNYITILRLVHHTVPLSQVTVTVDGVFVLFRRYVYRLHFVFPLLLRRFGG